MQTPIIKPITITIESHWTYLAVGDGSDAAQQLGGRDAELPLELDQVAEERAHQQVAGLSHQNGPHPWEVRVQRAQMPLH
jgi:hypothetical protein